MRVMKSTADIYRVKVTRTTVNSVGRRFREGWLITFYSFERAFQYWAKRNYELRCTNPYEMPRNEVVTVSEPKAEFQLLEGCRKKSYLSEYELP